MGKKIHRDQTIIEQLSEGLKRKQLTDGETVYAALKTHLQSLLTRDTKALNTDTSQQSPISSQQSPVRGPVAGVARLWAPAGPSRCGHLCHCVN